MAVINDEERANDMKENLSVAQLKNKCVDLKKNAISMI